MQRCLLGFMVCVGCADASDDGGKDDDADGDGIPASLDCNDADPFVGDRTIHLRESKSSMGDWDGFRIVRTAP